MNSAFPSDRGGAAELVSEVEGYSAVVVSSIAEIQSLQSFASGPPLRNDILLDLEFFLASASDSLTPKIVAVRHGSELAGVVYARDRGVFWGLSVVYSDLSLAPTLLGDPIERQNAFLVALKTLLASPGTRGMRLTLRSRSPEMEAVRRLAASTTLDFRFWRQRAHAVLSLPGTYEHLLQSFGGTTRRNFRYYRRRFETAGHLYLDNLSMDEFRSAALYLGPKCSKARLSDSIDQALEMAATEYRPLAVGLRHRNGEWLSVICGAYRPGLALVNLQLNNDRDFSRDSLSVVLRAYFIESLIHRGVNQLIFCGGTAPPLSRYVTYIRNLGISIDSPEYRWRLVRALKTKVIPRLPKHLKRLIVPASSL
jgi:hypothetical protein